MDAAGGAPAGGASDSRGVALRLDVTIDPVDLEGVEARKAVQWWSTVSGIPVIVNWTALENEGVVPDQTLNIKLRRVPAGKLLSVIMRELSQDVTLVYQVTPWYVRIMTRDQANRETVLRVYDINDLLHEVPDFNNAPSFDLNAALSNTNSGGSGGGGGGGGSSPFGGGASGGGAGTEERSRQERGEEIAAIIRDHVEPDIWKENGGEYASIRYFNGQLIVRAPLHVQQQIGMPSVSIGRSSDLGRVVIPKK
jgi:hypothetical protein